MIERDYGKLSGLPPDERNKFYLSLAIIQGSNALICQHCSPLIVVIESERSRMANLCEVSQTFSFVS